MDFQKFLFKFRRFMLAQLRRVVNR